MLLPPTLPDASPVANALAARRDILGFFMRLAGEAGPFAHYSLGPGSLVYFVNDAALVREVLARQEGNFRKWAFNDTFWLVFGQGVFSSEEPLHRQMQRIERPAFHQHRLAEYAGTMVETAAERQALWEEGDLDLSREMGAVALEIVARTLFSVSLGEAMDAHLDAAYASQRFSGHFGSSAEEDRAFLAGSGHFAELAGEILARRRRAGRADDDLLALLLDAQPEEGATVTDAQIVDEIRTFLLGGQVTTGNALAASFWLVSRDPDTETSLHRELDAALGGRPPTFADLPALGLCERIFLESLRLYPPVWVIHREAMRQVRLGGYDLPPGAKLLITPWTLHRDPELFPEPECFVPGRWENDARSRLPRGAFMPFSTGPRGCMGERFALLEGVLLLAAIAQQWRFEATPRQTELKWKPHLILWPQGGIWLRAKRRGQPPASFSASSS